MEQYEKSRLTATQKIQIADHMLTMTYPLVKDPKLLLSILNNIFLSYSNAMSALLHFERMYKRVPPFSDNFESKYNIFKSKCIRRFGIDINYLKTMHEIKEILNERKSSPVEFTRGDKFVICSDSYHMKTISIKEMKNYLASGKLFIAEILRILEKNERSIRQFN